MNCTKPFQLFHAEKIEPCLKHEGSDDQGITDIDAKHKDPLMCSLYAPDIYRIMTAMEVCLMFCQP